MTKTETKCPSCGGARVVKFGRSTTGGQRYYCKNKGCTVGAFQFDYTYPRCRKRIDEAAGIEFVSVVPVYRVRPL